MFFLVGLGLGGVKDITVRGLEVVRAADKVYLEAYTSILQCGPSVTELEEFYGRKVELADREMVEQKSAEIFESAKSSVVCLLVVGDPLGATTHCDLLLRAKEMGIEFDIVHNASIVNAIGCTGLQLYNFGEIVSIPFYTDTWRPHSYCDKILSNLQRGLHTLCLLDIKVKEQSDENLVRNRKIFEPPRYMTVSTAAEQLLEAIGDLKHRGNDCESVLNSNTICVGVARIGWPDKKIVSATLGEMTKVDLGGPLHSLVVVGKLHPIEEEMLKLWTSTLSMIAQREN